MGEEILFSGIIEEGIEILIDWIENMVPLIIIGSEG